MTNTLQKHVGLFMTALVAKVTVAVENESILIALFLHKIYFVLN